MTTRTHDPKRILSSFAGRDLSHGRDEGDFIVTEYLEPGTYKIHKGADGSTTRSRSTNKAGKITINCMSTSDTHKILTTLHARALASQNGEDIGVFELADLNGNMVEHADEAWIAEAPTNTHGAEVGKRAWVLHCAELVRAEEQFS